MAVGELLAAAGFPGDLDPVVVHVVVVMPTQEHVFAMVTSLSLSPSLQNRDRGVVGSADERRSAVSIVMPDGVFPKDVAYRGIVVGVLGIASEALRPVIEGANGVCCLLMVAWTAAVGWPL